MRSEIVDKFSALITAGFGLVAALAWNSAIQEVFRQFFGDQNGSLTAMFTYAVIVSLIAIFATLWIGWLAQKTKGNPNNVPRAVRRKR